MLESAINIRPPGIIGRDCAAFRHAQRMVMTLGKRSVSVGSIS